MACCRHLLYENHYINGKRVLLTKLKGAGTASGSFDRGGYCVSVLSPQSPLPFVFAIFFVLTKCYGDRFITYNVHGGDSELLKETR